MRSSLRFEPEERGTERFESEWMFSGPGGRGGSGGWGGRCRGGSGGGCGAVMVDCVYLGYMAVLLKI